MFILSCEDASHLGGPMGTEYTTHLFSKVFSSVDKAKEFAQSYQKIWPTWAKWYTDGTKYWVDSGTYIWKIAPVEIG